MKVAIIGTAPGSRAVAPFEDPEWNIWACSQGNQGVLPKVDAWFELHTVSFFTAAENRAWGIPYLQWLKSQTFPVYMQEKNDAVPGAIVFPYRKLIDIFGRNWFTSSVAWMMAYALIRMKEGDVIGLFGVDMAAAEEHHTAQRSGIYRFIEIARERGVEVTTPFESDLGQPTPLYGYCESTRMGRKMYHRMGEIVALRGQLAAQREKIALEIAFADGALNQAQWVARTFLDGIDAELDMPEPVVNPLPLEPAPMPKVPLTADFAPHASGLFVPKSMTNGKGEQDHG